MARDTYMVLMTLALGQQGSLACDTLAADILHAHEIFCKIFVGLAIL
jgi:hypothetical protein